MTHGSAHSENLIPKRSQETGIFMEVETRVPGGGEGGRFGRTDLVGEVVVLLAVLAQ